MYPWRDSIKYGRSPSTERKTDHRRHFVATGDRTAGNDSVDLIGLEHLAVSHGVPGLLATGVTENAEAGPCLLATGNQPQLPTLGHVIARRQSLPGPVREAVILLLQALQRVHAAQTGHGVG